MSEPMYLKTPGASEKAFETLPSGIVEVKEFCVRALLIASAKPLTKGSSRVVSFVVFAKRPMTANFLSLVMCTTFLRQRKVENVTGK